MIKSGILPEFYQISCLGKKEIKKTLAWTEKAFQGEGFKLLAQRGLQRGPTLRRCFFWLPRSTSASR